MLKKIAILFALLPLLLFAKGNSREKAIREFEEIVERGLQEFRVPGLAIGVVVDGKVILAKGYGLRDIEKKLPANADTLYLTGSCTKAFTTFLIGMYIDEGLLHWDQPVVDLLPTFRMWDSYSTHNTSLRDLLTHRWGLSRHHDWFWYNSTMTRKEVLDKIRYLQPNCKLRERFNYNNLSYLVAASALENVTGETWEEMMQKRILTPLGMTRSTFFPEVVQNDPNYAVPYLKNGNSFKRMPLRDLSLIGPAVSLTSSVNEMIPWIQLQLNKGVHQGRPMISQGTFQEIQAPQMMAGHPGVKEVLIDAYSLGWSVQSYRGHLNLSHDGGPEGFTTIVSLLPHQNIGVVILCNRNLCALPHLLSYALYDCLLGLPKIDWLEEGVKEQKEGIPAELTFDQLENKLRKKETHPSHAFHDYEGEYIHPGYGTVTIAYAGGALQATYNRITYLLDHWHYDVFVVTDESEDLIVTSKGTLFTFHNNLNGDIDELRIPFEPSIPDIVFKKKPPEAIGYLKQFVGSYQIYHYTVEVEIRNNVLCAVIPGQPIYELIPCGNNEFNVKSVTGYTVRFVMQEEPLAQEVQLIQPYGTFTAKRIH